MQSTLVDRLGKRLNSWAGAAVFAIALFSLSVSWAVATPPGSAPDEPDHYVRALAVAGGQFIGRPVESSLAEFHSSQVPQVAAESATIWVTAPVVRAVQIPARLAPGNMGCTAFQSLTTGDCYVPANKLETGSTWALTRVGTYPPLYYALVGVPMLAATDTVFAVLAGRLFSSLVAVLLITAALVVLVRRVRSPFALAGFALACSPLITFDISSVSPSAWEFAGAFAVGATIAALAVSKVPLVGPEWLILGVGGALLGSSRASGPMFVGIAVAVFLLTQGFASGIAVVRGGRYWALCSVVITLAATLFTFLWDALVGWHSPLNLPLVISNIGAIFDSTTVSLIHQVGYFGWLDTPMPQAVYPVWICSAVALTIVGAVFGRGRQRWAVIGLAFLVVLAPLIIWTLAYSDLATVRLQGRWYMAVTIWLLLISGAVVAVRTSINRFWRALALMIGVLWVLVQGIAWYTNAQRYAVGRLGPPDFWNHSLWQPVWGWGPWLVVTCASLVVMLFLVVGWQLSLRFSDEEMLRQAL